MKTLSAYVLSIALCLGVATMFTIGARSANSNLNSEARLAASAAFRDGMYLGKLAAKRGEQFHLSSGRWAAGNDRSMFASGYSRGYNDFVASAGPNPSLHPHY